MSERPPHQMERRPASNENTDYVPEIVLRNKQTRISAVGHHVPGKPAATSVTLHRRAASAPRECKISMRADELKAFIRYVTDVLELQEADPGRYLLVPLDENDADVTVPADRAGAVRALVRSLSSEHLREQVLDEAELDRALVEALTARSRRREITAAVDELVDLLENDEEREETYQQWFKRHGWAFGTEYLPADEVRRITRSDEVDFMVPATMNGFRDIIELKRPDHTVLVRDRSRETWSFSAEVSAGIGQCHRYLENLEELRTKGLLGEPRIALAHPRATLVIGRSQGWGTDRVRALEGLNARLHGIRVVTYDNMLAVARRLQDLMAPRPATTSSLSAPPPSDDDVPF